MSYKGKTQFEVCQELNWHLSEYGDGSGTIENDKYGYMVYYDTLDGSDFYLDVLEAYNKFDVNQYVYDTLRAYGVMDVEKLLGNAREIRGELKQLADAVKQWMEDNGIEEKPKA
ncbi:MAG: hypothetical protein II882_05635 [Lachnospiraceae bacterium]|nr:hypothetical protein [Lachnospiraceae bacterium]